MQQVSVVNIPVKFAVSMEKHKEYEDMIKRGYICVLLTKGRSRTFLSSL